MKCFMRILLLALVFIVAGCASTGVVPIGQDTYMISKQGSGAWSSTGELTADVVREATQYCVAAQKKIMPTSVNVIPSGFGRFPEVEYQFMCLSDGDHDLKRPKLQRERDPDRYEKQTIDININQKQ